VASTVPWPAACQADRVESSDLKFDLSGRVAVVTGASKGIGRAISEAYVAAGASVVLVSRKQAALDAVAEGLPPERVMAWAANVGDPDAARTAVDATMERFGRIDVLVNNAAVNPFFGPIIKAELSHFDKVFQTNVRGPWYWSQLAHRAWMAEHGGSIINVVSVGGIAPQSPIGVYNTSKAALIHMSRIMAAEMGPAVRVNSLAPGLVKTDFARALWEGREEEIGSQYPLGRLGEPQDLAGAALFLASDWSSWITGQCLVVDGGALVRQRETDVVERDHG
jgi:NAD(P)-dependent dehydrogenase (short-subunit alcohol dehydrogenase family)